MSQPLSDLPKTVVLSYLTPDSAITPTRVRKVAFILMLVMGGVYLILAAMPWYVFVGLWGEWDYSPTELFRELTSGAWDMIIVFLFALVPTGLGMGLLAMAFPVRRGYRWACLMSSIVVALLVAVMITTGGIMATVALVGPVFPKVHVRDWSTLVWMIPAVVLAIGAVVAKDLFAYLRWIHRTPVTDKPPVKFLP